MLRPLTRMFWYFIFIELSSPGSGEWFSSLAVGTRHTWFNKWKINICLHNVVEVIGEDVDCNIRHHLRDFTVCQPCFAGTLEFFIRDFATLYDNAPGQF